MGSSAKTNTTQKSEPWQVQQPYLQTAFQTAQNNLDNATANTYNGQQVAQFNPDQLSTFRNMLGFANANGAADTSGAVGTNLANQGSSAISDALERLKSFSTSGGTDANIAAATKYANNPATDGLIDGALRDARRSVSEQALPQVARSAAATGNTMSSRRAISEGIIERGLADKTADVSSTIRSDQFNKGLQLAQADSQFKDTAMLDAFKTMGGLGGDAAKSGVDALTSSIAQKTGLFDLANQGGAGLRDADQAAIDNAKGMSEYATGNAWDNLMKYYGIVGSQNWGGTTTGEKSETPSIFNVIGGLLGAAGSFGSGFGFGKK